MKRLFVLLAGLAASASTGTAVAQDLAPIVDPGLMGFAAANAEAQRAVGPRLNRSNTRRTAPAQPVQFTFRPDPAVRQRVYARFISQVRKSSPAEAGRMAKELNSGQFTRGLAQYLGRYNMSSTNLADTTSLYLATAWLATRASSADPSPGQMQGLRRQVTATLASMPAMASANNATKQEWAEASLIQAALASAAANEAARNPGYAAKARSAVAKGVQSLYQIDLLSLDLTSQGLR